MAKVEEIKNVPKFEDTDPIFEDTHPIDEISATSNEVIPSTSEAAIRGLGQGVTLGTEPILAGVGSAASQLATGDFGPKEGRSLESLYAAFKQMKDQEIAKNLAARAAHPIAYTVPQVVGSIPPAIATGGAATAAGATGLEASAGLGAATGLGSYLGEEKEPTVKGAVTGAGTGLILGTALHEATPAIIGAGKSILSGIKSGASKITPQVVKEGYQAGKEGINLLGKEAKQSIIPSEASKSADNLTNRMLATRDSLGQDVGKSIGGAAEQGRTINLNEDLKDYLSKIDDNLTSGEITQDEADRLKKSISFQLFEEAPEEAQQMGSVQQTQKFIPDKKTGEMRPVEMKKTVKVKGATPEDLENIQEIEEAIPEEAQHIVKEGQLSDIINQKGNVQGRSVKSASELMSPETEGITRDEVPVDQAYTAMKRFENLTNQFYDKEGTSPAAKEIASQIKNTIKTKLSEAVPEFAQASQTYDLYNQYLPETIIAKGESPGMAQVRMSGLSKPQLKLKQSTESLITELNKPGISSKEAKQTFDRLSNSLDTLQTIDKAAASAAEVNGTPYTSIFSRLGLNKDEILNFLQSKSKRANAYDTYMGGDSLSLNTPKTLSGAAVSLAGKTGVAAGNIGGQIYNASKEVLNSLGQKLVGNAETRNLGQALIDAVTNGDNIKRNAAIFAIMQSPKAKNLIDPNLKENIKENENPNANAPTGQSKYSF